MMLFIVPSTAEVIQEMRRWAKGRCSAKLRLCYQGMMMQESPLGTVGNSAHKRQ